jgi:transcriptional regulator with XRE-family HTH domain
VPFSPDRLRIALKDSGLTYEEAAAKAGVSLSTINTLVAGKHVPGFDTAEALALALGKDLSFFSSLEDEPVAAYPGGNSE